MVGFDCFDRQGIQHGEDLRREPFAGLQNMTERLGCQDTWLEILARAVDRRCSLQERARVRCRATRSVARRYRHVRHDGSFGIAWQTSLQSTNPFRGAAWQWNFRGFASRRNQSKWRACRASDREGNSEHSRYCTMDVRSQRSRRRWISSDLNRARDPEVDANCGNVPDGQGER